MPATPKYLLLEGTDPIGPKILPPPSESASTAVYGFSGKKAYDRFVANSDRELRPYPLMEGYLRKQDAEECTSIQLLVLDADGPSQQNVVVVTVQAALQARQADTVEVNEGQQMVFVPESGAYRVSDAQ